MTEERRERTPASREGCNPLTVGASSAWRAATTLTTSGRHSPTRRAWLAGSPRSRATSVSAERSERPSRAAGKAPAELTRQAVLVTDGDQTRLVVEGRGLPLEELAAHGAGWQAHLEDLVAHSAGRERTDWRTRWTELTPSYREQTVRPAIPLRPATLTRQPSAGPVCGNVTQSGAQRMECPASPAEAPHQGAASVSNSP
jgi:hypothetical protein